MAGLACPVVLAWPVGALFAAGVAWVVGKVSLGLRSDYLAIATLGISEIVIAVLKFEGWMSRGVNNVSGIDRPVTRPVELQAAPWVQSLAETLGWSVSANRLCRLWAGLCGAVRAGACGADLAVSSAPGIHPGAA